MNNNIIYIDQNEHTEANFMSRNFIKGEIKNRAYLNVLAAEGIMNLLAANGISVEDIHNLHSISRILENLDIADIMLENIYIDVRAVFDENQIFIPKSHFDLEVTPDIYVAVKISQELDNMEFLGFFKPEKINKENANELYYFINKSDLQAPEDFISYVKSYTSNKFNNLSDSEIFRGRELSISMADHDITDAEFKEFLGLLIQSNDLRDAVLEFDNFETLSFNVAKVFEDGEILRAYEQTSEAINTDESEAFLNDSSDEENSSQDDNEETFNYSKSEEEETSEDDSYEENSFPEMNLEENIILPEETLLEGNEEGVSVGDIVTDIADAGLAAGATAIGAAGIAGATDAIAAGAVSDEAIKLAGAAASEIGEFLNNENETSKEEQLTETFETDTLTEEPVEEFMEEPIETNLIEDVSADLTLEEEPLVSEDLLGEEMTVEPEPLALEEEEISLNPEEVLDEGSFEAENYNYETETTPEDNVVTEELNEEFFDDTQDLSDENINSEVNETIEDEIDAIDFFDEPEEFSAEQGEENIEDYGEVLQDDYNQDSLEDEDLIDFSQLGEDYPSIEEESSSAYEETGEIYEELPETTSEGFEQEEYQQVAMDNSTIITDKNFVVGEIPIDINHSQQHPQEQDGLGDLYNSPNGNIPGESLLNSPKGLSHNGSGAPVRMRFIGIILFAAIIGVISFAISKMTKPSQEAPQPITDNNLPQTPETVEDANTLKVNTDDVITMNEDTPKTVEQTPEQKQQIQDVKSGKSLPATAFLDVKKLSWEVPDYVSYDANFKQYFQSAGKSLKLALTSDLLLATEYVYSNQVRVSATFDKSGTFKESRILLSSGSNQVDKIVLQTVNQTLGSLKAPHSVGNDESTTVILKIYF